MSADRFLATLRIDVRTELHIDVFEEQATQVIQETTTIAENAGVDSVIDATEVGSAPYRSIRSYVDETDMNLVVMGTHGRTGLERYLLGSVTEKTVRTASVPVLTVPDPSSNE